MIPQRSVIGKVLFRKANVTALCSQFRWNHKIDQHYIGQIWWLNNFKQLQNTRNSYMLIEACRQISTTRKYGNKHKWWNIQLTYTRKCCHSRTRTSKWQSFICVTLTISKGTELWESGQPLLVDYPNLIISFKLLYWKLVDCLQTNVHRQILDTIIEVLHV